MERSRPQDAQQIKGSTLRHRERSDESVDKRPSDVPASQDEKKPFRRVRSPSRPRAWLSSSYQHKFGGRFHQPRFSRDDPGFGKHKYQHFTARDHFHRRDHPHKPYRIDLSTLRERERPGEKQRYESKEGPDGSSPPKQRCTPRAFAARSTSSSDKDTQLTICQSDRKQSRERDHRGAKSKERERSRDGELPPTASQTVARERAIQQKRREIDEVYYQECEMFGHVVKMLIEKDPSLEASVQSSLQQNLRDIGQRCVEAMKAFIEDYDSKEPPL
ncbi:periphilin-1-like [Betta splendens]|uniref:Periphilin-1-like n=1 Tax=Betta splendens TaxID=158456 RepID=A0A6P7N0C7_BETSP|nr:periphilin-1-like [Betta splendens]